ncbi:cytochrome P450 [Rhizopogon salebrosus TDB-379]|nr:cytochrome P450 [Rhizopogon salebrosus TDB-379]
MTSKRVWLTYVAWWKQYGEICSVSALETRIVILNSAKAAIDVLEKKSAVNSDRPYLTMARDLAGWGDSFFLQQYGERFQQFRTMFHEFFGSPDNLRAFHLIRQQEAQRFVQDVSNAPGELVGHMRKAVGATILKISYGYEVQTSAVKYLPSWFPGTSFQRTALLYKQTLWDLVEIPYNMVLEQIALGTAPYSFTSSQLEGRKLHSPEEDNVIKWSALATHTGGTDTTVSAIYAFFLAMTIYPEIQALAQAELDSAKTNISYNSINLSLAKVSRIIFT